MLEVDIQLQRGGFQRQVRIASDARVLALTGPSGAGKTSVLNAIAGLLRPTSGRIAVEDRVLFDSTGRINTSVHQRRIGYVFQEARLFPHLDINANLRYGRHAPARATQFGFDAVVELLGISPLLQRRPRNLSGGEAQRVAIGRALLSQPALLLLDEPLSALDAQRRGELIPYLRRVCTETGLPMVYVSHQPDEVQQLADAVHVLD
ncbi:molybdate transport system ATP-binding protein [Pseudoxanthomonas sp. GM95]|uniref:ATP-binding cassette domain-containing protein n=1 Tax=Pseudoxanthomonas sp. GM95 TaxID=1881043 RepID=UPI0008C1A73A|nr:ATP-binding cassette domain-containing protein [Pseudoxanthomonas sp. GM95]SEL71053.1 molybdate transport system ATP-binding protein [Pseudoxanthomonas sp. GM95]